MSDEKIVLLKYLKQNNLKMTSPREKILKFFLQWEKHMSPDEMFAALRNKHPGIGRATVYRTLKLLAQSGLARTVELGDGFRRFEPKDELEQHGHLICRRCGYYLEFESTPLEEAAKKIALQHGFLYTPQCEQVLGICKKCQKKTKKKETSA